MALVQVKNNWGSQGTGLDPVRPDLFRISLAIPPLVLGGGANLWDSQISFAVAKFPFPAREREMIPIKYLNQTNFVIGGDVATTPVDMSVRYAFNQRTVEILERWHQLTSNSQNGGVALTSEVKTSGYFWYQVPNMPVVADPTDTSNQALMDGPRYFLEGVLIRGLKPAEDADMTQGNQTVMMNFSLQIDRYYPVDPSDLSVLNV
jgi:hypothetical protein